MNILYHHRSLADGAEGVHIEQIVSALRSNGHCVEVCSLIGSQTNRKSGTVSVLTRLKGALPRAVLELAEVGYGGPAAVWLAARIQRLRPDFIYERYACANTAGILAKRYYGIPLILEINAPLVLERQRYEKSPILGSLLANLERRVFRSADRCLVVSTPLAEYVASLGTPEERIEVMPNGAVPDAFDPADRGTSVREHYQIGKNFTVGFCGVLRPWHGVELLIEAVAMHMPPETHVLLIGDGPSVPDVLALAKTHGLRERLHVTGRIEHRQMSSYLAACDVAVSPRATFYASPMKIPEYMAAGRAVVAPRMPNIEDLVDDGRTGLLFDPDSVNSLGVTLSRLFASPGLRESLAKSARREVEGRLNWRRNAERITAIADEIRHRPSKAR